MSIYKMSDSTVMKFVELYRENECLWNTTSYNYKNREARNAAYKNICDNMNISGFGMREVAQKIKNLRSAYYQEVKRIENSRRQGATGNDVYKPKVVWFKILDSFLKRHVQKRISNSTSATKEHSLTQSPYVEQTHLAVLDEDTMVQEDKQHDDQLNLPATSINKKRNTSDKNVESYRITPALKMFDEMYKRASNATREDEFEFFGRYVAATLRKLPAENAISAESRIQVILSQERINALRKNAPVLRPAFSNPPSVSSLETNYDSGSSLEET